MIHSLLQQTFTELLLGVGVAVVFFIEGNTGGTESTGSISGFNTAAGAAGTCSSSGGGCQSWRYLEFRAAGTGSTGGIL